jgi:7,8-dihydropterin-6-yl-methyl-4-(beta-D-ribofuranosyl)aminobenzene 5'-phosphate synthase
MKILHFSITGSPVQRIAGADRPPWQPLSKDEVHEVIRFLQDKRLKRMALSPHDSCDWTLDAFKEAWGPDFDVMTVGQRVHFPGNGSEESV